MLNFTSLVHKLLGLMSQTRRRSRPCNLNTYWSQIKSKCLQSTTLSYLKRNSFLRGTDNS